MAKAGRAAVLLTSMCLLAAACGSDDAASSTSDDTSEATDAASDETVDQSGDQAAAEAALLVLGDFEPDWTEVPWTDDASDEQVRRDAAACAGADSTNTIDFGGARAVTGDFTSPAGATLTETVTFAPSVDAAAERVAAVAADEFLPCIQPLYETWVGDVFSGAGLTLESLTGKPMKVASVEDETVAYRLTINVVTAAGVAGALYVDLVVIQSGHAVAGLTFQADTEPFSDDDFDHYLQLAGSRLGDAPQ